MTEFNSDLVFEILSRSSLKTVAKCRLNYNALTYESAFTNLHSQRTQTESGFFLQTTKHNKPSACFVSAIHKSNSNISLDFLPDSTIAIAASSVQGVLVCIGQTETTRVPPEYYVCKPVTKEWKRIPKPKTRYLTEALGIKVLKSNPLHYKIVRLSKPRVQFVGQHCYYRCEIFDSMSETWRQIEQVKLPSDRLLSGDNPAIYASGQLHWRFEEKVFAFDVDDEKYSLFPLPSPVCDKEDRLTDYEGKLAMISKKEGYFEVWVLEKYEQKEWSKRVTFSTDYNISCPVAFCNSDVAVIPDSDKLLFFKFKNENSEVETIDTNLKCPDVFPFQSDFEHCDLRNEIVCNQSSRKRRRKKSNPRQEYLIDVIGRHCSFRLSPTFIFLLLLFFCYSVCYVLDI